MPLETGKGKHDSQIPLELPRRAPSYQAIAAASSSGDPRHVHAEDMGTFSTSENVETFAPAFAEMARAESRVFGPISCQRYLMDNGLAERLTPRSFSVGEYFPPNEIMISCSSSGVPSDEKESWHQSGMWASAVVIRMVVLGPTVGATRTATSGPLSPNRRRTAHDAGRRSAGERGKPGPRRNSVGRSCRHQ
jgi:hypothetical protein